MSFPEFIRQNPYSDIILKDIDEINKDFIITETGDKPFKYIILDNFLKEEVHREIKNEMIDIPVDLNDLYKGELIAPIEGPMLVGYKGDWHDAYRMYPDPGFDMKMNMFMRSDIAQFLQSFWPEKEFTNEILIDLHHHRQFSRDGFVHNDYDPSKFYGDEIYHNMDISYEYAGSNACDMPHGNNRYSMKSLSWAYYIGYGEKVNEYQAPGGHTALFNPDKLEPVKGVEPIENRLLMFEIGPNSYHASRTNNSLYRDVLFGWYHSEMNHIRERFPNTDLCANVRTDHNFDPNSDKSFGNSVTKKGSR